jgi:hypothetical protein
MSRVGGAVAVRGALPYPFMRKAKPDDTLKVRMCLIACLPSGRRLPSHADGYGNGTRWEICRDVGLGQRGRGFARTRTRTVENSDKTQSCPRATDKWNAVGRAVGGQGGVGGRGVRSRHDDVAYEVGNDQRWMGVRCEFRSGVISESEMQ